jgi:NADPH:quinone reductase-like Zn-dependent oxidoreductase
LICDSCILPKYPTKSNGLPIDYHTQDFVEVIRQAEPDGLDAVFDGMSGDYFKRGYSLLKRGGILVGYGIAKKFPILEAAQANKPLESGQVIGNIVLLAPELVLNSQ